MKKHIINFVKYNKSIYKIYFYILSFCINVLKLFVKPDDKLILFNSFAGRKYDDSPKVIFEHMRNDERFKDYRFVWAFHNPEKHEVVGTEKIKTDNLDYFVTALKARVWITNSSVSRGLDFKGKNTFFFNTWHGTAMKKMGTDIDSGNQSFRSKGKSKIDIMMSQSEYDTNIFSRAFGLPKEQFLEVGLPRNDIYVLFSEDYRNEIRNKLGVNSDKKLILYCPTFREYERDENNGCVMIPPMDLRKWEEELKNEYVLLFRAHYEVAKVMDITDNDFVRNVTDYPDLSELMIVSDLLLSDYSSVFFDYSIMDKPMLHFTYDYEKYASMRGMYFDIRDYVKGSNSEDKLISLIKNLDEDDAIKDTVEFRNKYVTQYGNAGKQAVDCIANELNL